MQVQVQVSHWLAGVQSYLSAVGANLVQRSRGAVQETDDLLEVVVSDTPGAVNQEDQVGLGCLAD